MKASTLYHIVRADFLERFRRYSTLIVIGLAIYVTYLYLPSSDADYITLHMNGFRGVYNSAWIGAIVAVLTVVMIPLPAFYLVKNAVERDRRTGVGQILATTPLSKWQYILGKTLSNWAFLAAVAGVILLGGAVMQFVRGESLTINPLDYILPYLLLTLPMMALVAALAVLFESVSFLRGTLGNILYFFLFVALLTALGLMMIPVLRQIVQSGTIAAEVWEPTGAFIAFKSMFIAGKAASPAFTGGLVIGATPVSSLGGIKTFVWPGINWSIYYLAERLIFFAASLLFIAMAAWSFDRFDQTVEGRGRQKEQKLNGGGQTTEEPHPADIARPRVSVDALTRARRSGAVSSFVRLTLAELRVMVKGLRWWWYLIALALIAAGFFAPMVQVRGLVLPLTWLWPIALWSGLGNRDVQNRTQALFLSAPSPIGGQTMSAWLAGVVVALAMGSGAGVRLVLDGQIAAFGAFLIAAAFIPALALALGAWTGSNKTFEVLYVLLWYLGPINQVPALDFIGAGDAALAAAVPLYYLAFAVLLLAGALLGRVRQLRFA